jgi:putative flavoprotein involved in K+ transport
LGAAAVRKTTTVVIGAGHAGLAMSRCLAERAIDHVVIERGEVANSWKTERWDSLRLLTPNWQSRLPGYGYEGDDPDGFRTMPEVIDFLDRYAEVIGAPVETRTTVTSVRSENGGYVVETDCGKWQTRSVVLASGACNVPRVPAVAEAVPPNIASMTPDRYRNPDQLDEGGVLIVGASATGTQLADEIHRSGRPVTLAVGEHVRAPRVYRDRDIQWWMDAAGVHDERYDEVDDINRARNVPSIQLAGFPDRRTLDLNALTNAGVKLVGRLAGIADGRAQFSGSLKNVCALADLKMNRLLNTIDEWASEAGLDTEVPPPHRFPETRVEEAPPLAMDLAGERIKTIIWATGFRPDFSWLDVPVLDRKGRIRHEGGVVAAPGLYVIGLQFLRRRKSALIDGARDDAYDLADHLVSHLG